MMTGKLKKVFTDLVDDRSTVELTSLSYGSKCRKIYIGDNAGNLSLYSMKNGEFLKRVRNENEEIDMQEKFLKRQNMIKKKEINEVSNIIYLHEEKLLINASWDSTIKIYNENDEQESVLLRIMSGGHKDSDINALAYSSNLGMLASGSHNGIISIWDFEFGKLEATLLGHNGEITSLKFADPFPILISGSSDGSICVWVIKSSSNLYRYKCILRAINSYWLSDGERRVGINCLAVDTSISAGIPREPLKNYSNIFPNEEQYATIISQNLKLDHKEPQNASSFQYLSSNKKGSANVFTINEPDKPIEKPVITEELKQLNIITLEETIINPFVKPEDKEMVYNLIDDYKKFNENYDHDVKTEKLRCYIYIGDQKGFISLYDISEVLAKHNINPLKHDRKSDVMQLHRKDWVDVNKYLDVLIKQDRKKIPYSVHAFNTVMIKRWEAHQQSVINLISINEPLCYITCSHDKHVKIWGKDGEMQGDINLVKPGKQFWKIPFDWVKYKLKEIDQIFEVCNVIDKNDRHYSRLMDSDKENIRKDFLLNTYFTDKDYMKMMGVNQNKIRNDHVSQIVDTKELMASLKARFGYGEGVNGESMRNIGRQISHYQFNNCDDNKNKETDYSGLTLKVFKKLENYDVEHGKESLQMISIPKQAQRVKVPINTSKMITNNTNNNNSQSPLFNVKKGMRSSSDFFQH